MSKPHTTYIDDIIKLSGTSGVSVYVDGTFNEDIAKSGSTYSYEKKDRILTIFIGNINQEDWTPILPIVRKYYEETTGLVLKEAQKDLVLSYTEYRQQNPYDAILKYFKNVLSKQDYTALKMSLYLRSQKDKGRNVDLLKGDIRDRFSTRGSNIANLCNAGYFETEFMPLHTNSEEAFKEYFELAVGKSAIALFISSWMDVDHIHTFFYSMVSKAIKYHIPEFRIHAFGGHNVGAIKDFISQRISEPGEPFQVLLSRETSSPPLIEYNVVFTN